MTAIAVATPRRFSEPGTITYPVNAGAHIYEGALVCVQISDGMLVDGSASAAGLIFAGVAEEQIDGGAADGDVSARCRVRGVVTLAASSGAATDVGQVAYLVDNNTVGTAQQTGNIAVGKVVKFNSSSSLDIDITGFCGTTRVPRMVHGAAAFTTTGTTKTVSSQGLVTIFAAGVTPVIDASAAAANGQLGFTEAGSTGLPEVSGGNLTVTRVAGTDSGLKFVWWAWGI